MYGKRPQGMNFENLNRRYGSDLDSVEQASGFFTNPYEWPEDYDRTIR